SINLYIRYNNQFVRHMNHKLPHLYLRNPSGSIHKFNKSRAITDTKFEDKDPEAYRLHKQKLHASFVQLKQDRIIRLQQKTLVLENLAIVEIRFLIPFSDGANFKTRTRFLNEFGLSPVMQKDFNRTVLFAIVDEVKFTTFDRLLNKYIQSDHRTSPQGTPYAIMTALYDIKYHTADDIRNYCSQDLVFEFINNNADVHAAYEEQREILDNYLNGLVLIDEISSFAIDPYDKMVQIKGASRDVIINMAENFDILAQAHSLRAVTVKPDKFNMAQLTWDLNIRRNGHTETIVGVLDNGIRPIDPIQEVVVDGLDITTTGNALSATHQHGTIVASLAAV